jgi:cytochrome c-type biogenesis protein CcmE
MAGNNSIMLDYGLGQLYIYKGEMEKSILHFEKVIAKDPENYETIKVELISKTFRSLLVSTQCH